MSEKYNKLFIILLTVIEMNSKYQCPFPPILPEHIARLYFPAPFVSKWSHMSRCHQCEKLYVSFSGWGG